MAGAWERSSSPAPPGTGRFLAECRFENFAQKHFLLLRELCALGGKIENVDRLLSFRINQRHINVASLARQR